MSGCTYDYNWKDLLTSYDGSVITYDEIGNPLTYRDSMTMSWEGRRLSSINNGAINYEYDSSGIRSKKTVDGNTTVFYNIGGVKAGEYRDDGIDILYLYDDKGKIYGISVNEQIYYFMENVQGDVIGLYDYYGRVCARYTYDPFNILGIEVWVEDDQLSEALKTLTEKKRNIILLSYFMDMSDSEISEFIKISRSNVKYHRTKTLEAMRKIMEERK